MESRYTSIRYDETETNNRYIGKHFGRAVDIVLDDRFSICIVDMGHSRFVGVKPKTVLRF